MIGRKLIIGAFLTATSLSTFALGDLIPEAQLTVRDAKNIYTMSRENDWMKKFLASNLYQGLSIRLSPMMSALSEDAHPTWKGRLIDFLYERILSERKMTYAYFKRTGLISPFAMNVTDLSPADYQLLKVLIQSMRSADNQEIDNPNVANAPKIAVTPLSFRSQKLAVVLNPTCLSLSRDPSLAAVMSIACKNTPVLKEEGLVQINLKEFVPPAYPFVEKFVGVGSMLSMNLHWDEAKKTYGVSQGEISLNKGHIIEAVKVPAELAKTIPADAPLWFTLSMPSPKNVSPEGIETFLNRTPAQLQKDEHRTFTLVYLGPQSKENAVKVGLLVDRSQVDANTLTDLKNLLSGNLNSWEVKARAICGKFVGLSPDEEVLDKLDQACKGSVPSFENMPAATKSALHDKPLAAALYFNTGHFLNGLLESGFEEIEKDSKSPPELNTSRELLGQLPSYFLSGSSSATALTFSGGR